MPEPLMQLMVDCWAQEPAQRPSFAAINERLQDPDGLGIRASLSGGDSRSSSELSELGRQSGAGDAGAGADDVDVDATLIRIPAPAPGGKVESRSSRFVCH